MDQEIVNKLIPLKHGLKQNLKFEEISNNILKKLQTIPNLKNERTNPELINLICNVIEYFVKKKYNLNKESLLLYVLKKAIPSITDDELKTVKDIVHYLHSNKLILAVSNLSYVKQYIKSFFLKTVKP